MNTAIPNPGKQNRDHAETQTPKKLYAFSAITLRSIIFILIIAKGNPTFPRFLMNFSKGGFYRVATPCFVHFSHAPSVFQVRSVQTE